MGENSSGPAAAGGGDILRSQPADLAVDQRSGGGVVRSENQGDVRPVVDQKMEHGHAEPEKPQVLQNQQRPPVDTLSAPPVDKGPNVLDFSRRSTGGQPDGKPGRWSVDHIKASTNTWAFRVRWISGREKGPPTVITRVSDKVFHKIRKGNYEQFKQNIIAIHEENEGTLRASN